MQTKKRMRIVIKVGTNVLRAGTERIHRPRLIDIARQIADLIDLGHELLLVSSGAIFAGRELLGIDPRSQKKDIPHKQMLAAVGQGRLLTLYQRIFEMYDIMVAQALLTRADFANRTRYLNARNTLQCLLEEGIDIFGVAVKTVSCIVDGLSDLVAQSKGLICAAYFLEGLHSPLDTKEIAGCRSDQKWFGSPQF